MIHLLIAIAFSAMLPVLLKYAHQAKVSDEVVLSGNYFLAVLISLTFTLYKLDAYMSLWSNPGKLIGLMAIGLATGLFFYGAFYYYQKSVRENGVSLSIAVGKMGILIPVILSLILWQEFPTSIQWIGIILSLIAIGLINIHPEDFRKLHIRLSLLLFLSLVD